jgi:hypothetical protein
MCVLVRGRRGSFPVQPVNLYSAKKVKIPTTLLKLFQKLLSEAVFQLDRMPVIMLDKKCVLKWIMLML